MPIKESDKTLLDVFSVINFADGERYSAFPIRTLSIIIDILCYLITIPSVNSVRRISASLRVVTFLPAI